MSTLHECNLAVLQDLFTSSDKYQQPVRMLGHGFSSSHSPQIDMNLHPINQLTIRWADLAAALPHLQGPRFSKPTASKQSTGGSERSMLAGSDGLQTQQ